MRSSTVLLGSIALAGLLVPAGRASATEAHYACDGGTTLVARFSPPDAQNGWVKLAFGGGREMTLPQAPSADGGRYVGDGVEFWIKGRSATLIRAGESKTCSAP